MEKQKTLSGFESASLGKSPDFHKNSQNEVQKRMSWFESKPANDTIR